MAALILNNTTVLIPANNVTGTLPINLFYAVFLPILSLATITGNLMIIVAFWKVPALHHKPSELLVLNLSFVDLLTGFTLIMGSTFMILPDRWLFGEAGCRVFIALFYTGIHTGILSLITISVDRLLLVKLDYSRYLKIQSPTRIKITIGVCWSVSLFSIFLEQATWEVAKKIDKSAASIDYAKRCLIPPRRLREYSLFMFITYYLIPVFTVCASSLAFLYFLRKRLKKKQKGPLGQVIVQATEPTTSSSQPTSGQSSKDTDNLQKQQYSSRKRYIKPAITFILLVTAMLLCMMPYGLYVISIEVFCHECINTNVVYTLVMVQYFNACLDPIFYGMTNKKIRAYYGWCLPGRNSIQPLLT